MPYPSHHGHHKRLEIHILLTLLMMVLFIMPLGKAEAQTAENQNDPAAQKVQIQKLENFTQFEGALLGESVVPPRQTSASGTITAALSPDDHRLIVLAHFKKIVRKAITSIEIRQGIEGQNGPLIASLPLELITVPPGLAPTRLGQGPRRTPVELSIYVHDLYLTPEQALSMEAGEFYLVIKTTNHPNGFVRGQFEVFEPVELPLPLDQVKVPLPHNIDEFVRNRNAVILLGKALFWDIQVGSDNRTSCATCHFNAGADFGSDRIRNSVAPAGIAFDESGNLKPGFPFRGANTVLTSGDFPFHRLTDPASPRSRSPKGDSNNNGIDDHDEEDVEFDTSEIVGSQGVIKTDFVGVGNPEDLGTIVPDPVFNFSGANVRQVTGRNTPTVINAVFNDRNFWDGRADHFFNGVNPFGENDPNAKVWEYTRNGLKRVRVRLNNASAASQAVGPPLSDVEMSWKGREFRDLGRKILSQRPLQYQNISRQDSVLGRYVHENGKGLYEGLDYSRLIRASFRYHWWGGGDCGTGYTQMEENFSLFWGIAIMMYEATLISDQTPFDKYLHGNESALSDDAKEGLRIFMGEGKCVNCHEGPLLTGATVDIRNPDSPEVGLIELMLMARGPEQFYDNAFYNIGVRPTFEDKGVGASGPFGPFSATRRRQLGLRVSGANDVSVPPGADIAVDGAFKTPGLRNIELTGPYMHNGGMKSLEEVVEFYARGGDFPSTNIDDLDPDIQRIDEVIGDETKIAQVVAFLKSLTDERVRYHRAPFDHPELPLPYGTEEVIDGIAIDDIDLLPAVGKRGYSTPLPTFEENLELGLDDD